MGDPAIPDALDWIAEWMRAGASGFGIGTALYRPGDTADAVAERAREIAGAYDAALAGITG